MHLRLKSPLRAAKGGKRRIEEGKKGRRALHSFPAGREEKKRWEGQTDGRADGHRGNSDSFSPLPSLVAALIFSWTSHIRTLLPSFPGKSLERRFVGFGTDLWLWADGGEGRRREKDPNFRSWFLLLWKDGGGFCSGAKFPSRY